MTNIIIKYLRRQCDNFLHFIENVFHKYSIQICNSVVSLIFTLSNTCVIYIWKLVTRFSTSIMFHKSINRLKQLFICFPFVEICKVERTSAVHSTSQSFKLQVKIPYRNRNQTTHCSSLVYHEVRVIFLIKNLYLKSQDTSYEVNLRHVLSLEE